MASRAGCARASLHGLDNEAGRTPSGWRQAATRSDKKSIGLNSCSHLALGYDREQFFLLPPLLFPPSQGREPLPSRSLF